MAKISDGKKLLNARLAEVTHWRDRGLAAVILGKGADPNAVLEDGTSPLHGARGGCVELLLAAGADPRKAAPDGRTPLMVAAKEGDLAKVRTLLPLSDVCAQLVANGRNALMLACERADAEVVAALAASGDVEARADLGATALIIAAASGCPVRVTAMLDAGAEVDGQDAQGETALTIGASMGGPDVVATLLAAGADPAHRASGGRTAFLVARDPQSVALLGQVSDVEAVGDDGYGAIELAGIRRGGLSMLPVLKAVGDRWTPGRMAAAISALRREEPSLVSVVEEWLRPRALARAEAAILGSDIAGVAALMVGKKKAL